MRRKEGSLTLNFRKRKGNVAIDLMFILAVLFIFSIAIIMGYKAFNELNADIQADTSLHAETKEAVNDLHTRYPSTFDGIFVFAFGLLWLMLVISAFMIDSHPLFFIVMFIILIFVFIAMMYLGNTFEEFMLDSEVSSLAVSFPMTYWIMTHLLPVAIVTGLSTLGVMYAKTRL